MIIQTIHEIVNPYDVYVKGMGQCLAKFMISGSVSSNPQFIVKQYHTGIVRTIDQNDLLEYGNPSAGESINPQIPDDWKPKKNITGNVWNSVKDKKALARSRSKV